MNDFATGVLAAMMLLTVADVFLRYAFRRPIIGTMEITQFMLVTLAFCALAWCAVTRKHLTVDLIVHRFPPRLQAIVDSTTLFVGLVVCAIIAWRSFLESLAVWRLGLSSSQLLIPQFPFFMVIAAGCAMLCVVMVAQLIEDVAKAVTPKAVSPGGSKVGMQVE